MYVHAVIKHGLEKVYACYRTLICQQAVDYTVQNLYQSMMKSGFDTLVLEQ